MKYTAAAILLLGASPAYATGGFSCEATDGSNLSIHATTGRVITGPIIGLVLIVDGKEYWTSGDNPTIAMAQSWSDEKQLMIDLVDTNYERFEAQLRVRLTPRSETAKGTLLYGGKKHPVKCEFE